MHTVATLTAQDMLPQLSMLRGMALQDDAGAQSVVKLFDVHQLPTEPASRFKAVFQERATWLLPDLQAFIEDLQVQYSVWAIEFEPIGRSCQPQSSAVSVSSMCLCSSMLSRTIAASLARLHGRSTGTVQSQHLDAVMCLSVHAIYVKQEPATLMQAPALCLTCHRYDVNTVPNKPPGCC